MTEFIHKRTRSNTSEQKKYSKILRPPSASQLQSYSSVKQQAKCVYQPSRQHSHKKKQLHHSSSAFNKQDSLANTRYSTVQSGTRIQSVQKSAVYGHMQNQPHPFHDLVVNATRYESATAQGNSTVVSNQNLKMEAGTQPDEAALDQMSLYNHHLRTEVDLRRQSAQMIKSKVNRFSEQSSYTRPRVKKDARADRSKKEDRDFYKKALGINDGRHSSIQKGGEILQRTDEGGSEEERLRDDRVSQMNLDKLRQTISKTSEEPKTALLRDADNLWTSIPQQSLQSGDVSGNNSVLNRTLLNNLGGSQRFGETLEKNHLPATPDEITMKVEKSRTAKQQKTGTVHEEQDGVSETRLKPTMQANVTQKSKLSFKRNSTGNSVTNSAVLEAVFSKKQQSRKTTLEPDISDHFDKQGFTAANRLDVHSKPNKSLSSTSLQLTRRSQFEMKPVLDHYSEKRQDRMRKAEQYHKAMIQAEVSIALDKARREKKRESFISSGKGTHGELSSIGIGQCIKKRFFSDVRSSMFYGRIQGVDDDQLPNSHVELQRASVPDGSLADLNDSRVVLERYNSYKNQKESALSSALSKGNSSSTHIRQTLQVHMASPAEQYGVPNYAQIERISQLSQLYASAHDMKRPASSGTLLATSMNRNNERNYDSVRQSSFKSQPGIVSVQSTKEQEIADYLSNQEDYEVHGANEVEELLEQKANLNVSSKGASINIKTKGAFNRPKSKQKHSRETLAQKQQRLFAWHHKKRVPHVPIYNPKYSLLPDERIQHLETLAARRAGLVDTKHVSQTYLDEMSYIKSVQQEQGIVRKARKPYQFVRQSYLHHNPEFQMKKSDLKELEAEFDNSTPAGKLRSIEADEVTRTMLNKFRDSEDRIILEQANYGHIYAPIKALKKQRELKAKSALRAQTSLALAGNRDLSLGQKSKGSSRSSSSSSESKKSDVSFQNVTNDKLLGGVYLPSLEQVYKKKKERLEDGLQALASSTTIGAQEYREEYNRWQHLTSCAFEAAQKPHLYRRPVETNLLMCMLFKMFRRIEPKIARSYNLLAALSSRLQTRTFSQGQRLVSMGDRLDTIMLIYSGQVRVVEAMLSQNQSHVLDSGQVIGQHAFSQREFKLGARFTAEAMTDHVKVLEINLKDADNTLDEVNHNQLATFVFYAQLMMSSGSVESRHAQIKIELNPDTHLNLESAVNSAANRSKASHQQAGQLGSKNKMQKNAFHLQNRNEQLKKGSQKSLLSSQDNGLAGPAGVRRGNKSKRINRIYKRTFQMVPYFLRDFTNLLTELEIKTLPPGTKIFDSGAVPRRFFVIKKGKVKLDDIKQGQAMVGEGDQARIEGEWFGYESLIEDQLWYARQASAASGQMQTRKYGYRAVTLEYCELVSGRLDLMQKYLKLADIKKLHSIFQAARK